MTEKGGDSLSIPDFFRFRLVFHVSFLRPQLLPFDSLDRTGEETRTGVDGVDPSS